MLTAAGYRHGLPNPARPGLLADKAPPLSTLPAPGPLPCVGRMSKWSSVAAAAFCPFLSAASPKLFGLDSYTDLAQPRDLAKIFDTPEYAPWRSFRESEDARFVTLAMPRVLARLPYGANQIGRAHG